MSDTSLLLGADGHSCQLERLKKLYRRAAEVHPTPSGKLDAERRRELKARRRAEIDSFLAWGETVSSEAVERPASRENPSPVPPRTSVASKGARSSSSQRDPMPRIMPGLYDAVAQRSGWRHFKWGPRIEVIWEVEFEHPDRPGETCRVVLPQYFAPPENGTTFGPKSNFIRAVSALRNEPITSVDRDSPECQRMVEEFAGVRARVRIADVEKDGDQDALAPVNFYPKVAKLLWVLR